MPKRLTIKFLLLVIARLLAHSHRGRPSHGYYCGAVRGMESECDCGANDLLSILRTLPLPKVADPQKRPQPHVNQALRERLGFTGK